VRGDLIGWSRLGALVALALFCAAPTAAPRTQRTARIARPAIGRCTREDVQSFGATATFSANENEPPLESAAIAAEAARSLPPVLVYAPEVPPPSRFWPVRFVESIDMGARLKALSRLRILRLFDNSRVTVFLGIDHAGHAGLHVQQQDPSYLPPLRLRNAPASLPPLRAVPLSSM
jgi:hypothetical protein